MPQGSQEFRQIASACRDAPRAGTTQALYTFNDFHLDVVSHQLTCPSAFSIAKPPFLFGGDRTPGIHGALVPSKGRAVSKA